MNNMQQNPFLYAQLSLQHASPASKKLQYQSVSQPVWGAKLKGNILQCLFVCLFVFAFVFISFKRTKMI